MLARITGAAVLAGFATAALALDGPLTPLQDPMDTGMWDYHQIEVLGDPANIRFDDRVKVFVPASAEDSTAVPVLVDATAVPGVRRIMIIADYGPFPHLMSYYPETAEAKIALRTKIDQATVIRAAVETESGAWLIGSAHVDAAGGGCTAPAHAYADADWEEKLGNIHGRIWPDTGRARMIIDHPMDTGLAHNIPVFIVEELNFAGPDGGAVARIELHEPISEDPSFSLFFEPGTMPAVLDVT
ncbi:MAG: quinoprotein dehydrogenase-associated SoxYZ-like carrier, partial [Pseudomonadota bacterium]